jgi:hypothetical protein
MIVNDFMSACSEYEKFSIWEVENMNAFFQGNGVLTEIFEKEHKMHLSEFDTRRSEIEATNLELMEGLLEQVGDKHFLIFTVGSTNHGVLIQMQDTKVMDFGVDIVAIKEDHVYIMIMDKKKVTSTPY